MFSSEVQLSLLKFIVEIGETIIALDRSLPNSVHVHVRTIEIIENIIIPPTLSHGTVVVKGNSDLEMLIYEQLANSF
jgi:hypothetical protein